MLIICDECELPISGTVKKVSGNFNLHPHCLKCFIGESAASESITLALRQPVMMALVSQQPNGYFTFKSSSDN